MGSGHPVQGRLWRWLRGGNRRLIRGSDRIEVMFRWVVLLGFLAAVPFGVVVGTVIQKEQAALAAEQVRERQTVPAVVLADTVVPENAWSVPARVAWQGDNKAWHVAVVAVDAHARRGLAAGTEVRIWVTSAGGLSQPPQDPSTRRGYAIWGGMLAGLAVPMTAGFILWVVHASLDVHRLRQWETDWRAVEPLWNSNSG